MLLCVYRRFQNCHREESGCGEAVMEPNVKLADEFADLPDPDAYPRGASELLLSLFSLEHEALSCRLFISATT